MTMGTSFDEALDAVHSLPADQQADLIEVVRRRLAADELKRLVADVGASRDEHAAGNTRRAGVSEIMREVGE